MCECLDYEDGDRYQCEFCVSLEGEKDKQLDLLRASVARLTKERDEAREKLVGVNVLKCLLVDAEAEVARLRCDVRAAMDYAGNRWSEWGERAENVGDMLGAALAEPKEGKNG